MPRRRGDNGPALQFARKAGRRGFSRVFFWQVAQTGFRLAFAGALAVLAGTMIQQATLSDTALGVALASLLLAIVCGYVCDVKAAGAEADLGTAIRAAAANSMADLPLSSLRHRPAGETIIGLQRHPAQLARLVVSHGIASRVLGVGPLMAAAAICFVSWEAALTLVLATPVMIVFFVLVGSLIHARAEAQEKALGRLAAQFADRVRTLPTILANHAPDHEHAKLEVRMRAYADATMNVLRVAFLNAGIIDFFSSLAIAVLAVFLGLGHLGLIHFPGFSGLQLSQSLFILMMAPDYFAPFRRYAEQYHAKAEGMAAAEALDWLFVEDERIAGQLHPAQAVDVRARVAKALRSPLPAVGLIAVIGPSGSGKSTCLRALAGVEKGVAVDSPTRSAAWVSSDAYVPAGSLADAIGWNRPQSAAIGIAAAAGSAGLLDDPFLPGGLSTDLAEGGENLSGGQRMRLAVARALLSEGIIIADEPTAKLDPVAAKLVRDALVCAARVRLVIVATHDDALAAAAQRIVDLRVATTAERRVAA